MCRLQFYRNIQKKSTNPSIRTLVSTLQCRFLCVFRILPYTHSAKAALLLGAERVFNLTTEGTEAITKELQEKNNGLGIDLCFEASGSPQAVKQGLDILRNRGVYLIPGQYSNSNGIEIQPQLITFKALHIIGSSQYSVNDVKKYLEFLKNNQDLYPLISNLSIKYPIEEINEAIEEAKKGNKVKTLLVMK